MYPMRRLSDGVLIQVTKSQRELLLSNAYATDAVSKTSNSNDVDVTHSVDDVKTPVRRGRPRKNKT